VNSAQLAAKNSISSGQILRRTLRVLLIFQYLAVVTRADISNQELQKWVDDSTLVFEGTIVALDSNVSGITQNDNPVTVRVDDVMKSNGEALKKFGSLVRKQLTVVEDPASRGSIERRVGASAVFFVEPLLYETNIAVIVKTVADGKTVKDLSNRLQKAVEQHEKQPLVDAVKSADLVMTGIVQQIRLLPDTKIDGLRSLANGRDLYSEHSPKWMEAVIRGKVLKGNANENRAIVVFPSTGDRMWAEAPKFTVGQTGTWMLHGAIPGKMEITDKRAKILLDPEPFDHGQLNVYTALHAEDFQLKDSAGKNEALIRDIVKPLDR
jgi:hypothetical protein